MAGLSWRPIFLVNVPVGAVAIYFAPAPCGNLPRDGRPTIDWGGIALLSLFLILLSYPLVEGQANGWPRWMQVCLVASAPALALFVFYEWSLQLRRHSPLVNLRLFRDPGFSVGLVMVMTFFGGLSGFFLGLTIFLQEGMGYGPFATGLVFLGFGLGFIGCSLLSAQLARRVGPRAISVGTAMMASGLVGILWLTHEAHGAALNVFAVWPLLIWFGGGQGLALPTLISAGGGQQPHSAARGRLRLRAVRHDAANLVLARGRHHHGPVLRRARHGNDAGRLPARAGGGTHLHRRADGDDLPAGLPAPARHHPTRRRGDPHRVANSGCIGA